MRQVGQQDQYPRQQGQAPHDARGRHSGLEAADLVICGDTVEYGEPSATYNQ